jgi:hypothetical protein
MEETGLKYAFAHAENWGTGIAEIIPITGASMDESGPVPALAAAVFAADVFAAN